MNDATKTRISRMLEDEGEDYADGVADGIREAFASIRDSYRWDIGHSALEMLSDEEGEMLSFVEARRQGRDA